MQSFDDSLGNKKLLNKQWSYPWFVMSRPSYDFTHCIMIIYWVFTAHKFAPNIWISNDSDLGFNALFSIDPLNMKSKLRINVFVITIQFLFVSSVSCNAKKCKFCSRNPQNIVAWHRLGHLQTCHKFDGNSVKAMLFIVMNIGFRLHSWNYQGRVTSYMRQ